MSGLPKLRYTMEEYLELDWDQDERLDCDLSLNEIYRDVKFDPNKNK